MKSCGAILLGFRGAGKSTVAALLAASLKIPVIDLDERLEQRTQSSLPDFIDTHGESEFRKLEAKELEKALEEPAPYLLVTGGGIVESERSLELLSGSRLPKILLHCEIEVIWERLKHDSERLRVGGIENLSDLKRLWEGRAVKFRGLATFTVDSKDLALTAKEVEKILNELS